MEISSRRALLRILFLFVLGFAIYSNSLWGEFLVDDYKHIINNASIKNIFNVKDIWHSYNNRFLTGLTYALNYSMSGLNVFSYHVFNVIFHVLASILFYYFLKITFQTPRLKSKYKTEDVELITLFSTLLFLCHTIQVQAVAYISQRFVTMGTCCYLLTCIFYVKARLSQKNRYLILSYLSMIIGVFVKEFIVTVGVTLCVFEYYFFETKRNQIKKRALELFPYFLGIPFFLFIFSQSKHQSATRFKYIVHLESFDINFLFTEMKVFVTYLRFFFFPVNLNHSYDYPVSKGFFELPTVFAFLLLSGLIIMAVILFKRHRLMSFCIVWFFITTSVEATAVIFGNRWIIYDHWMYLAMIGLTTLFMLILNEVLKNRRHIKGVLIGILVAFCFMTFQRNKVWQTEIGLWKDVVKKAPTVPYHNIMLATAYNRKGDFKNTEHYLKRSIEVENFEFPEEKTYLYMNLGNLYLQYKKFEKALDQYKVVLQLAPGHFIANMNSGSAYAGLKNYALAIQYLRRASKINSKVPEVGMQLGSAYLALKRYNEAYAWYRHVLSLDKNSIEAYYQVGYIDFIHRRYKKSLKQFNNILAIDSKYYPAYNAIGAIYTEMGDLNKAKESFSKALALNPNDTKIHYNVKKLKTKQKEQDLSD